MITNKWKCFGCKVVYHRSCRLLLLVLKLSWASLSSCGSCSDKVRRIYSPSQSLDTVQAVALLVMGSRKAALDSHCLNEILSANILSSLLCVSVGLRPTWWGWDGHHPETWSRETILPRPLPLREHFPSVPSSSPYQSRITLLQIPTLSLCSVPGFSQIRMNIRLRRQQDLQQPDHWLNGSVCICFRALSIYLGAHCCTLFGHSDGAYWVLHYHYLWRSLPGNEPSLLISAGPRPGCSWSLTWQLSLKHQACEAAPRISEMGVGVLETGYFCISQTHMLKFNPQCDGIWKFWAFGRWLGLEGGASMNGISALIKETLERSVIHSTIWGHTGKTAVQEKGHRTCQCLDLGLPASRTVTNKFPCLLSHPVCGLLIIAIWAD